MVFQEAQGTAQVRRNIWAVICEGIHHSDTEQHSLLIVFLVWIMDYTSAQTFHSHLMQRTEFSNKNIILICCVCPGLSCPPRCGESDGS